MNVEIFYDLKQNTPEWFAVRAGIVTASEFHTVMAEGAKKGTKSLTREEYMYKLAGEIITGEHTEGYTNKDMERGHEMEPEARAFYAMVNPDVELKQVGFVKNHALKAGCSPDSLFDFGERKAALEIKTCKPHILGKYITADQFPPKYKPQCQGICWIAELEFVDLSVYWPKMPRFIKREYRDETYIREMATAVDTFNFELAGLTERIRRYGS